MQFIFLPYKFRRPIAGDLLHNDGDLVTMQMLLGHANVQTTAQMTAVASGRRSRRWEPCRCGTFGERHTERVERHILRYDALQGFRIRCA